MIPATGGTFEARRKHERPKVTKVTRMEALRHQKDDSYEDGDPERALPCEC